MSVASIRWAVSRLDSVKDILGTGITSLLLSGFCWSLTTLENRDWDAHNIDSVFRAEAGNISVLIKDRHVDVRALYAKFGIREGVE